MKIVILLLTVFNAFLIQSIFCNDSILSKFHQNGYKLKDTRAEVVSYDKKYFNFFEIKTFKFNRTTAAINFTAKAKVNMEDKLEIVVQGYKFLSNEYRHFPVRFQVNLKKCFDADAIGLADVVKCGNITTFYFYKDITYHACNFVLDETRFPPLTPNGRYRLEMTYLYLNKEIAVGNLYTEVYTPIPYPKKKKII